MVAFTVMAAAQTPDSLDRNRSKYATYSFSKDDQLRKVSRIFSAVSSLTFSPAFGTNDPTSVSTMVPWSI